MINVTFYADNIDKEIVVAQKNVFDLFGIEINQVKPTKWEGHGAVIDSFMATAPIDEVVIIWDIDCIPLNKDIVTEAAQYAARGGIFGVAQRASHIPDSIIYAGPAFLAISVRTWHKMGKPTFACTKRSDCAGEITHIARELGIPVHLVYPTTCTEPLWKLDSWVMFGKGTTFGQNDIYHAFLSRKDNGGMFIKKCKQVFAK